MYTHQPQNVPQNIQTPLSVNTLSLTPGAAPPNTVLLNPDFFVERFLELPKHPASLTLTEMYQTKPTFAESGNAIHNTTTITHTTPNIKDTLTQERSDFMFPEVDELSSGLESMVKSEPTTDKALNKKVPETVDSSDAKRVPGLMKVEVSTTSRNLAMLWEQDDYLITGSSRGARGRSKPYLLERTQCRGRGRRPVDRLPNDESRSVRYKASDVDHSHGYTHRGDHGSVRSRHIPAGKPVPTSRSNEAIRSEPEGLTNESDAKKRFPISKYPEDKKDNGSKSHSVPEVIVPNAATKIPDKQSSFEVNKSKRMAFVTIPRQQHAYKQFHSEYDVDGSIPVDNYRSEHGRRGRGFQHSNYGARSYNADDVGSRHGYKDSAYYSRSVRGSSTTRGRRGASHSDFRGGKNQDDYDARTQSLYPSMRRAGRGDAKQYDHVDDQTNLPISYDTYPRSNADRHHEPYQKYNEYSSTARSNDVEQTSNDKRTARWRMQPSSSRGNHSLEKHSNTDKYQEEPDVHQSHPDEEDNEIPTVRVPAAEPTFQPRSHHTSSHGGRTTYFRNSGFRRPPHTRGVHFSQQQKRSNSKRTAGASVPNSYRPREHRDHDNDGEGGASTGINGGSQHTTEACRSTSTRSEHNSHLNGNDGRPQTSDAHDSVDTLHPIVDEAAKSEQTTNDSNHNNTDYERLPRRQNYNTGNVSGYRGRRAPFGNRYGMHQSYQNSSTRRSYQHRTSKTLNVAIARIPPLMSIKPQGPFTHDPQGLESLFNDKFASPPPTEQNAVTTDPEFQENLRDHQNQPKTSEEYDYSDDSSSPLDGFTKVVSKSSREFARRRMQQLAGDKSTRRHPSDTKVNLDVKGENTNTRYSSGKIPPKKIQTSSIKPTFMGPPIHLSTTAPLTSAVVTNSERPKEAWIAPTSIRTPTSSSTAVLNPTTTRTWSKVVGSKSTSVTSKSDTESKNPSTFPVSTDMVNSTSVTSDSANTTSQSLNTALSVSSDYKVVQQIWSSPTEVTNPDESEPPKLTIPANSSTSSLIELGPSTVSNNICKVKPQQQQPPTNVITTVAISAPICTLEHSGNEIAVTSVNSLSGANAVTSNNELDSSAVQLGRSFTNNELQPDWVDNVTSLSVPSHRHANRPATTVFPNPWPPTDHVLNSANSRISTSVGDDSGFNQLYAPFNLSDTFYGLLANSGGEHVNEFHPPSHNVRGQSCTSSPYSAPLAGTTQDVSNYGLYSDISKLGAHFPPVSQHPAGFLNLGASGQLYMTSQSQTTVNGPHTGQTYSPAWPIHPSQNQPITHPQRYRQRLTHQLEPYRGFAYQPDLQSEYSILPNVSACIQPDATGLFSTVQASHSQSNYHPTSTKFTPGQIPATDTWGASDFMTPLPDYNTNTLASVSSTNGIGENLFAHPLPQGGYNSHLPGSLLLISSGPNSTYVGVIGGGRPGTHLANAARRGGLAQAIYQPQNIGHSQTATGQAIGLSPPIHMPSAFYHSMSPSHERVHLQQYAASHNRTNLATGYLTPRTGLYAPHFAAPNPSNQVTPPPLQPQWHAYSYGHRPGHSSRTQLGTLPNHGGSTLFIPGGPSSLTGYAQSSAPLTDYPMKPVLPSL